jgi:hypothetical protein
VILYYFKITISLSSYQTLLVLRGDFDFESGERRSQVDYKAGRVNVFHRNTDQPCALICSSLLNLELAHMLFYIQS